MAIATRIQNPAAVREELSRVLASDDFDASDLVRRFLAYVVNETLCGRSDQIETSTVARSVFARGDSFNEEVDPIVKIVAARLRRSLDRYYLGRGRNDRLRILLRSDTCVPVFDTTHASSCRQRDARHGTTGAISSSLLVRSCADGAVQTTRQGYGEAGAAKCPICGCPAIDLSVPASGTRTFRCLLVDGEFDVADECLDRLRELDEADRHLALNKAIRMSISGKRPRITRFSIWQVCREPSELT